MQTMATINLRLPVDIAEWLQEEADRAGITVTTAARILMAKAKITGLSVTGPEEPR